MVNNDDAYEGLEKIADYIDKKYPDGRPTNLQDAVYVIESWLIEEHRLKKEKT
jgi:hypothetical protein